MGKPPAPATRRRRACRVAEERRPPQGGADRQPASQRERTRRARLPRAPPRGVPPAARRESRLRPSSPRELTQGHALEATTPLPARSVRVRERRSFSQVRSCNEDPPQLRPTMSQTESSGRRRSGSPGVSYGCPSQCDVHNLGKIEGKKELFGVQVVFARLVDYANQIVRLGGGIGESLIDLPQLKRGRVAGIANAHYEALLPGDCPRHGLFTRAGVAVAAVGWADL